MLNGNFVSELISQDVVLFHPQDLKDNPLVFVDADGACGYGPAADVSVTRGYAAWDGRSAPNQIVRKTHFEGLYRDYVAMIRLMVEMKMFVADELREFSAVGFDKLRSESVVIAAPFFGCDRA